MDLGASHIPWRRQTVMANRGWAPNAREAAQLVEETYEKLKQMHGL